MNKERFHNALALALGYKQIVKVKRYNIIVDEITDNPKVIIKDVHGYELISFMADEADGIKQNRHNKKIFHSLDKDIYMIMDAVHQAYIQATTNKF